MDAVPDYLRSLVDDAAIFPPGDLPVQDAVPAHLAHQAAWYASTVGPFVIDDRRLEALSPLIQDATAPPDGLAVSVVATGGAGSIDPAVRAAHAAAGVRPVAVEAALRARDDLTSAARRVSTVLALLADDGVVDDDLTVYVELPVHESVATSTDSQATVDEIDAAGLGLKFRTGGADADAFPTPLALATAIDAALDREVPFKCTAGLHHAVRRHDPATGFEHHGFLNVLLATRACLDGAGVTAAADILALSSASSVGQAVEAAGATGLASARRWFCSFGSCSIAEPIDDLVALGILARPDGDPADTVAV